MPLKFLMSSFEYICRHAVCRHDACERSIKVLNPNACADEPHALERLEAVLKPIMWRNDKSSVGDELKLPSRTLEVLFLKKLSVTCL